MRERAFTIFVVLLLCIGLSGCDKRTEEEKLMDHAVYQVVNQLNQRYLLKLIATSESGDESYYTKIGLHFAIYRVLNKEEGRKILVESVEEILTEINSAAELLPYLQPSPFTFHNIDIVIFAYHPDQGLTFYPEISVFSVRRGTIEYKTEIPEKPYDYYTEESESYEEALELVRTKDGI